MNENLILAQIPLSLPLPDGLHPVLVILTGLPGSGKTHLARALCRAAEAKDCPLTLIGSDPLRALLFETASYTTEENRQVYQGANRLIRRLLIEQRHVLYDAVNLSEHRRQNLRLLALDANARPLTIQTTADPAVIHRRLAERQNSGHQPGDSEADWEVYLKLAKRAERIQHQHVQVDTTQDIGPTLLQIVARIKELAAS